jgi:NADH:ubiquinone oxidoreductase subunit 4 (subunit M)
MDRYAAARSAKTRRDVRQLVAFHGRTLMGFLVMGIFSQALNSCM